MYVWAIWNDKTKAFDLQNTYRLVIRNGAGFKDEDAVKKFLDLPGNRRLELRGFFFK